jgi:UDP-glucose:(heptosyl)LPS alpha-1,3-glucosyltransferase
MNLVFCLYEYFPYGGLQRDFLKIACNAMARGHAVRVLTMDWQGDKPAGLNVQLLPHTAISNHRRCLKFTRAVTTLLLDIKCDAVVGFNKMPGLDLYFAADSCYQARTRRVRLLASLLQGRYRTYAGFERAVFSPEANTEILLLSPQEKSRFMKYYGTPEGRFHLLPPGISPDRFRPANALTIRAATRAEFGLVDDHFLLLMVGSAFQTKGVDRAMRAVAGLPEALRKRVRMIVIGKGKIDAFAGLAKNLRLAGQVDFLGGREDVLKFLLAADLLLHPARTENTGTVLVEAMAAGLPVLVTENCGYAFHVRDAGAGRLVPMPFRQAALDKTLMEVLSGTDLASFAANGVHYASRINLTGLYDTAVDVIEAVAARKALR